MLDEHGKLKYPTTEMIAELEKMKTKVTEEVPVQGIVKLRVSFTLMSYKYINISSCFYLLLCYITAVLQFKPWCLIIIYEINIFLLL